MVNIARNVLIILNNLPQIHLKLLQTAETTGNLIGKEIVDRITKVLKTSPENNSETITSEHDIRNT